MSIEIARIILIFFRILCYIISGYCISRVVNEEFKDWEHYLFTIAWPILWLEEIIIDWIYENK